MNTAVQIIYVDETGATRVWKREMKDCSVAGGIWRALNVLEQEIETNRDSVGDLHKCRSFAIVGKAMPEGAPLLT